MSTVVRSAIPTLVYRDVAAAHDFLVEVFGFEPGSVDRAGDGTAMHAEVKAGGYTIWLHRPAPDLGYDSPVNLGAQTAGVSVVIDDVQSHYEKVVAAGGKVRSEPEDQPYGFREYAVADLDNRLWTFMTPIG